MIFNYILIHKTLVLKEAVLSFPRLQMCMYWMSVSSYSMCVFMSHTYASYACLTSTALLIIKKPRLDVCQLCTGISTSFLSLHSSSLALSHIQADTIHSINLPSFSQVKFRGFVSVSGLTS